MNDRLPKTPAIKHREAAVRRLHRRVASEELKKHGTPKSVTMRRLQRSRAASLGNKARWARYRAHKKEAETLYAIEHPPVPGAAHMHKGILHRIEGMTRHERMERARLGMARCLMTFKQSAFFTDESFEVWRTRILKALTYQRGKYRKLPEHTEAQIEMHVLLELCIDSVRQGSAPLLAKWLRERQVAEREEEIKRLKLHNRTHGFSI